MSIIVSNPRRLVDKLPTRNLQLGLPAKNARWLLWPIVYGEFLALVEFSYTLTIFLRLLGKVCICLSSLHNVRVSISFLKLLYR